VEADYLYATSLSVEPFRLGQIQLAVLPVEPDGRGGLRLLTQPDILGRGDAGFATWLARAEEEFQANLERHERRFEGTVIDYLNTQNKVGQEHPGAVRVVWGKGGTHVRAAVVPSGVRTVHELRVHGFVVDLNQYYVECRDETEAHYLCAMLNSRSVDDGITAFQTRGQFGPRDIHRRPVEHVPIPMFDPDSSEHRELARLSQATHVAAVDVPVSSRNLSRYREQLGDPVRRIDELAERLLA
jgi:hypothetical protein